MDEDEDDTCPNCGRISWAAVDMIGDTIECTRCGHQQKAPPRGDTTGITYLGPISEREWSLGGCFSKGAP